MAAYGIATDPRKVKAAMDWPAPTNIKELRSFFGFGKVLLKIYIEVCHT